MMLNIEAELKSLKLFGMAAGYAEVASQGLGSLQALEGLLSHLLHAEAEDCHIRSIRYQLKSARFPVHSDLASFDFESAQVDHSIINHLSRGQFIDAAHNVVLVGGTAVPEKHILLQHWVSKQLLKVINGYAYTQPLTLLRNWSEKKMRGIRANWLTDSCKSI